MMFTRIITLLLLTLVVAQDIQDIYDEFPASCASNPCKDVPTIPPCPSCLCGNKLLGPMNITANIDDSYNDLLHNYTRFGGLCPKEFLDKWTQPENRSRWAYPPQNGFALDPKNPDKPLTERFTLHVGLEVDRFGPSDGRYLAPVGTPYAWRSVPPNNLNEEQNWWVWRVNKPIEVLGGRSAPAFEQPGGGLQFYIPDKVSALVRNNTLVPVKKL